MSIQSISQYSSSSTNYQQVLEDKIPEDSRSAAVSFDQEMEKDLKEMNQANQAAGAVGEDPSTTGPSNEPMI